MPLEIASNALISLIILLLLWVLVFLCWRSYAVDSFRQDLEELKAELFGLALLEKIDLSHPSYKLLGKRIDAMITWAPRLNAIHLFVARIAHRSYASVVKNPWDAPEQGHPLREQLIAINQWLLLRAFFQAVHLPAFLMPSFRVVWTHSAPISQSGEEISKAVEKLKRLNFLAPLKILVYEAVEAQEIARAQAATAASAQWPSV